MRKPSDDSSFVNPWWLDEEVQCEHCSQLYSLDTRYHCIQCDGPICPLCIVVVKETGDIVCPSCRSASQESGD